MKSTEIGLENAESRILNERLRIVIVSPYGIEASRSSSTRIFGLAKGLKEAGCAVWLVTHDFSWTSAELYDYSFLDGVTYVKADPIFSRGNNDSGFSNDDGNSELVNSILTKFKRFIVDLTRLLFLTGKNDIVTCLSTNTKIKSGWKVFNEAIKRDSALINYIRSGVPIIVTSFGPEFVTKIGKDFKNRYPHSLWIADYRDASYFGPNVRRYEKRKLLRFDALAFKYADIITGASERVITDLLAEKRMLSISTVQKAHVLYSGFTESALVQQKVPGQKGIERGQVDEKFRILYAGGFYPKQHIEVLIRAVAGTELEKEIELLIASPQKDYVEKIIRQVGSPEWLRYLGHLPRSELEVLMKKMNALLILKLSDSNEGIITGKFFQCLKTNIPIIALGDGDREFSRLASTVGGVYVLPYDEKLIRDFLRNRSTLTSKSVRRVSEVMKFRNERLAIELVSIIREHMEFIRQAR